MTDTTVPSTLKTLVREEPHSAGLREDAQVLIALGTVGVLMLWISIS